MALRESDGTVPVEAEDVHKLRLLRCRVEIAHGPDAGIACDVPPTGLVVGTAEDCDLVLSDPSVSRHHAEIVPEAYGVRLRDTDSRNGTYFAGARIREARIRSDTSLRMGETTLLVHVTGESDAFDLSTRIRFGEAIGTSAAMRRVFAMLEHAAKTTATVLLEGESGTGKDVLARAIHQESPRKEQPFVVVDCGAIPENLIESEVFGHEKGAFTGATASRAGAFEQAHGGTIFLDEIGELPLGLQPKLLRVLESRAFRRVGGMREIAVDVRVVAATNRGLAELVRRREFREDLYYRLAVVHVVVPRLSERLDDIPMLAESFYRRIVGDEAAVLPVELTQLLSAYTWPGNARELRNVIERFAAFRTADRQALFGAAIARPAASVVDPSELLALGYHEARERVLESFHREYLTRILERSGGSMTAAAERIGIPRTSIYRMLQRLERPSDEED